jgi:hypothetical protein
MAITDLIPVGRVSRWSVPSTFRGPQRANTARPWHGSEKGSQKAGSEV